MLIGQLIRPLGYLTIRHPYKWVIDWLYPTALTILVFSATYFFGEISTPEQLEKPVSMALAFIQSLPGFYIAALAAIATFGRADIDDILPEPTPQVIVKYRGKENLISLTRRRFLAMLFAFLTAESIILILFSILIISVGAKSFMPLWGFLTIAFIYTLLLFQMILATFWGLYYLGYKLHE